MRTIFISHSAKSDDDRKYLEALADGLTKANFDVWLDRYALKTGDDWNQKIGNHLVYCQGAVVLVSRQSLASPYVQHEISNLLLRWRRERNPATGESAFPLCPVLLAPDITPDLEQGFPKAIRFLDVNYLTFRPAAQAVAELIRSFAGLSDLEELGSPLGRVEEQISGILEGVRPRLLKSAAVTAQFPAGPEASVDALALHLTRCLLTRNLEDGYQFLAALGGAIMDEQRRNIFHLMAPSWVSAEAARSLADAIARTPPDVCVLNGSRVDFTPQMYLRRARNELPRFAGHVVSVKGVTHGLAWEKLRRVVRQAVANHVGVEGDPADQDFDGKLQTEIRGVLAATRRPILVPVPVAQTDLDLVVRLGTEPALEGLTFLALCEDPQEAAAPRGLTWLQPPLGPCQEHSAFKLHQRLLQTLA